MRKLFLYYSFSGSGDEVAKIFGEKGYEIRKVKPKKEISKIFIISMFQGGFLATTKHKSKLADYDNDISAYDEIVVGSPIWAGSLACPTNTVLDVTDFSNKKLSFVLYSGGGEAPKAVKYLKNKYNAEVIELKDPKKYLEEAKAALKNF